VIVLTKVTVSTSGWDWACRVVHFYVRVILDMDLRASGSDMMMKAMCRSCLDDDHGSKMETMGRIGSRCLNMGDKCRVGS